MKIQCYTPSFPGDYLTLNELAKHLMEDVYPHYELC